MLTIIRSVLFERSVGRIVVGHDAKEIGGADEVDETWRIAGQPGSSDNSDVQKSAGIIILFRREHEVKRWLSLWGHRQEMRTICSL